MHHFGLVITFGLSIFLPPLSVLATGSTLAQENPRQILDRAVEYHQKGSFKDAAAYYERFLEIYPDVADVRSNLGATYVQLGRLGDAITQYKQALELGNATDPVATRFNLALAHYKSLQLNEAVENLEIVLRQNPKNQRAALVLADSYLRMERYQNIVELLDPFEQEGQSDLAHAYLLGTALIRTGEVERGQQLVDRILRKGDSAEAHMMLGTAYMMVRDVPNALKEFERALELNPTLPYANAYMGKTLREMGRVDEAYPYFRKELEVNPFDFDSHLYVGVFNAKHEQKYDEAMAHFDQALKIRPGSVPVRFQVGLVYILTDRIGEALEIIEAVVEEAPDFLEAHVTLTQLYFRLKRKEDAARHREIVRTLRAEKDSQVVKAVPESP